MDIATARTAAEAIITGAQRPELESPRENGAGRSPESAEANRRPTPAGPAVVADISPAALQSSRSANSSPPEVTAAQAQGKVAVAAETRSQESPSNELLTATGRQSLQTSRIDTVA